MFVWSVEWINPFSQVRVVPLRKRKSHLLVGIVLEIFNISQSEAKEIVRVLWLRDNAETEFISTSGVKQGDNLAPFLFLFAIKATIDTMHCSWNNKMQLATPQLEWYPNAEGYLNKRSPKSGTHLDHKDTFYADDSAFIFLSKEDLIKETQFVKDSFAKFGLEVHLVSRATNSKSKTEATFFPSHSNLSRSN